MPSGKFKIYRNLNKKCFSILRYDSKKRGYRLFAHEREIYLDSANFKVSQAGRNRVLMERVKNVHAFVLTDSYSTSIPKHRVIDEIYYNPYSCDSFMMLKTEQPIFHYAGVIFKDGKCYAVKK